MLSTTSEFSYGINVNMLATVMVAGLASVAAVNIKSFGEEGRVMAPERWKSGVMPWDSNSYIEASACRLAALVSPIYALRVSIGVVVFPITVSL